MKTTLPTNYQTTEDLTKEHRARILHAVITGEFITAPFYLRTINKHTWLIFETPQQHAITIDEATQCVHTLKMSNPNAFSLGKQNICTKLLRAAEKVNTFLETNNLNERLSPFHQLKIDFFLLYGLSKFSKSHKIFFYVATLRPRKAFAIRQNIFSQWNWQNSFQPIDEDDAFNFDSASFALLTAVAKKYPNISLDELFKKAHTIIREFRDDVLECTAAYDVFQPKEVMQQPTYQKAEQALQEAIQQFEVALQRKFNEMKDAHKAEHKEFETGEVDEKFERIRELCLEVAFDYEQLTKEELMEMLRLKESLAPYNIYDAISLLAFIQSQTTKIQKETAQLKDMSFEDLCLRYQINEMFDSAYARLQEEQEIRDETSPTT